MFQWSQRRHHPRFVPHYLRAGPAVLHRRAVLVGRRRCLLASRSGWRSRGPGSGGARRPVSPPTSSSRSSPASPSRSVCNSKCVSRAWRDLISHPDHRSKLPQTLAGFFYNSTSGERFSISALHFNNVSGRGPPLIFPSFSFLPKHQHIVLHDCCNGLRLCRCCSGEDDYHYYVCNPTTKKWVAVPDSNQTSKICTARLGFNPAVSPHFHVLDFLEEDHEDPLVTGVEVYSSETGGWVHAENDVILVDGACLAPRPRQSFLMVFCIVSPLNMM